MDILSLVRRTPVTVDASTSVFEVARAMGRDDVGIVLITEHGTPVGTVTDRELVIRAMALGDHANLFAALDDRR